MALQPFGGSNDRRPSRPLPTPPSSASLAGSTRSQPKVAIMNPAANLYLQGDIEFDRENPISDGGYGELFAGLHPLDGKVALKRLRIHGTGEDRQRYLVDTMAEARVWRALVHPNVLRFLGILFEGREVYLISPLVKDGSLPRYIFLHPNADRAALLREVAEGLAYLHGQGIVHGDVKGSNILVLSGPRAALCDFGLSKILATSVTTTKGGLGTFRWQSPELMDAGARSLEADVYAYGMTIYEIISGRIPFHHLRQDSAVIVAVLVRHERPSMEGLFTAHYARFQDVVQRCWATLPESRPSMTEVSQLLLLSLPPNLEELLPAWSLASVADRQRGRLPDPDNDVVEERGTRLTASPVMIATLKGHTHAVISVTFSPDGSRLATGSGDSTVRLWNVSSGAREMTIEGHTSVVQSVAFSPDGLQLVSGSWDHDVWLWDVATGTGMRMLNGHRDVVNSVAFSPNGSQVVSGSNDQTVRLWDPSSGAENTTLRGHDGPVFSVAFSPDGSKLASGSADKTVQLWDAASGAKLRTLGRHADSVYSVVFTPDGLRLASASDDKAVRLWEVSSGQNIMTLQGHTNRVTSVALSQDGCRVASGSRDKTVRLWNTTTGAEIAVLQGHTNWVRSVSFSPDGSLLASGSSDETIHLWQ